MDKKTAKYGEFITMRMPAETRAEIKIIAERENRTFQDQCRHFICRGILEYRHGADAENREKNEY